MRIPRSSQPLSASSSLASPSQYPLSSLGPLSLLLAWLMLPTTLWHLLVDPIGFTLYLGPPPSDPNMKSPLTPRYSAPLKAASIHSSSSLHHYFFALHHTTLLFSPSHPFAIYCFSSSYLSCSSCTPQLEGHFGGSLRMSYKFEVSEL